MIIYQVSAEALTTGLMILSGLLMFSGPIVHQPRYRTGDSTKNIDFKPSARNTFLNNLHQVQKTKLMSLEACKPNDLDMIATIG
jgi:hypothetical protein